MDRLVCYHTDEDPKLDSWNSSIAGPIDYPDEIGTPRSKSNALHLVFKDPAQGFLTSLLSEDQSRTLDFELEAPENASKFVEDPLPVFSGRTEESFRRNVPSHKRATKLTERCHATCIQRLNAGSINQSLQWDLSGALVFDSKSLTDFPGFLVDLNLTSFGRVIG